MSWKLRHEGSPREVEGLTLNQVVQGLLDGHWEPTDEVMGPDEHHWVAIENHPQLAEVAMDLEPPPAQPHEDETRLDMTPLIDVCLVLLVFFILTTSYAALQRLMNMPGSTVDNPKGAIKIAKEDVDRLMIKVRVRMERRNEDGADKDVPVIQVEEEQVPLDRLTTAMSRYVKDKRKTELLIDYSPRVPHGVVVAIEDAAAGAGITKVHILVPKEELER